MELNKKDYKLTKLKHYFKKNNFFFIFNGHINIKNELFLQQTFFKLNLKSYKTFNNLTVKLFKNSIYQNFQSLIHSSTAFITVKSKNVTIRPKNLMNLNSCLAFLCFKLNHKLYSILEIKKINIFSFKTNMFIFYAALKTYLKKPFYKLKSIK